MSIAASGDNAVFAALGIYVLLLLALMLGCGFGARALMRGKGRSGAAGFCLGFFLGVIGVLIAALQRPTVHNETERLRQQMALLGIAPPPGAGVPLPPPLPPPRPSGRPSLTPTVTRPAAAAGESVVASTAERRKSAGRVLTITFDDGQARQIMGDALIGRSPVRQQDDDQAAELISVDDVTQSVSNTHLAIGLDSMGCWVEDRNATNGVVVTEPDGSQIRVRPAVRARVPAGNEGSLRRSMVRS